MNSSITTANMDYEQLNYFDVLSQEGVSLNLITDVNSRYKHLDAPIGNHFKIPPFSHYIWFTKPSHPSEVRDQDYENLKKILTTLNASDTTWTHYLWTNCKICIPETVDKFKGTNLKIRDIAEIKEKIVSYNIVNDLIEKKLFGIAADFFRIDLLNHFGGFYSDLNYLIKHSPEKYMKTYDFLVHTDRGGIFVDVYMIASKPNHPILEETSSLILRNFIDPPLYIQAAQNASMHIQDYTGLMTYLPFNIAFFKNINQETIDLAFPLEIKHGYPTTAKQLYSIEVDLEDSDEFKTCEITKEAKQQEIAIEVHKQYYDNEICIESILGYDSKDGNSWFEDIPLYND